MMNSVSNVYTVETVRLVGGWEVYCPARCSRTASGERVEIKPREKEPTKRHGVTCVSDSLPLPPRDTIQKN
jgi:hypothetical protein